MSKKVRVILTLILGLTFFVAACWQAEEPTRLNESSKNVSSINSNKTEKTNTEKTEKVEKTANANSSNSMNKTDDFKKEPSETTTAAKSFYEALEKSLARRGMDAGKVYDRNDSVSKRIVEEYGAVFLTEEKALPPPTWIFTSDSEVTAFQQKAGIESENLGGATVELQPAAMKALLAAQDDAKQQGLKITPRDGSEAGRRDFDKTLELWQSRVNPGLQYWQSKGKISADEVNRIKNLPIRDQVREILKLEEKGIYFSTNRDKSILYSVAAPGTSQHLSMLAFDANEFANANVRQIMAKHGWFRTVKSDAPHFTYLGVKEEDLPGLGLQRVTNNDGEFWVPKV